MTPDGTLPDCCFPGEEADVSEKLYCAYVTHTGGRNFLGNECPTWEKLPPKIRGAWQAAAEEAAEAFGELYKNLQARMREVEQGAAQ